MREPPDRSVISDGVIAARDVLLEALHKAYDLGPRETLSGFHETTWLVDLAVIIAFAAIRVETHPTIRAALLDRLEAQVRTGAEKMRSGR